MYNQKKLDHYSQKVNDFLKKNYPSILESPYRISFHQNEDIETVFLEIKIKSFSEERNTNLILNSQDEKITIGFCSHHCHFGGWYESKFEEDIKDAISTIKKIREGELIVAEYYRDEKFVGSVFIKKQEQFDEKKLLKEWKSGKPNRINFERFRLNE
ncbi:hypothetical protein V9L05_05930 [Bernardetia sp. Wsw4-3y2]|uniref:hypothetical protein n=1 Tax=Bernardetia sp. Wsw4-3y2 TaxID=3127471 RepID=UPI0030CC7EC5